MNIFCIYMTAYTISFSETGIEHLAYLTLLHSPAL